MKPYTRTGDKTISAAVNLSNNFTHGIQTIDGRPMATFIYGPNNPVDEDIRPGRLGEVYVRLSEGSTEGRARMWVSVGVTTETAKWEEITGEGSDNAAILDEENNFEELKQTIHGSQIVTMKKYITDYPNSSPDFIGQLAMCRAEDSDFCKMYVAYDDADGIPSWTALGGDDTPDSVVLTDKVNNFTEYSQTIAGNQIMSFVNGHEYNPGDAGIAPEHDGQFYVAFKTFDDGRRDVAIWVANKTTWVPVMIDGHDVARLGEQNEFRKSNAFIDPRQFIGPLAEDRRLAGVRVIGGTINPIANPDCKPRMAGEVVIWHKDGTDPVETTIFMSISGSADGSEVSSASWRQLWNSKGGSLDTSNLAKLDEQNLFDAPQKVGAGEVFKWMATTTRGTYNPTDAASPDNMPYVPGEIYIEHWDDAGTPEIRVWMATTESDAHSWICIFDSTVTETAIAGRVTLLESDMEAVTDTHIPRIEAFAQATDDRLELTNNALDLAEDSITNLDTAIDGLTTLVEQNQEKIAALETTVSPDLSETVNQHTASIADHETRITDNTGDIAEQITKVATLTEKVSNLEELHVTDDGKTLLQKIEYNLGRVIENENTVTEHKIIIDRNTTRIQALEDGGGGSTPGEKPPGYDALVTNVGVLETDMEQAKLDINANKGLVDMAIRDSAEAKTLAEGANTSIGTLTTTVEGHTTEIGTIKTDVEGIVVGTDEAKEKAAVALAKANTVETTATGLRTDVDAVTAKQTTETANLRTVEGKVSTAETAITNLNEDMTLATDALETATDNINLMEARVTANEAAIEANETLVAGHGTLIADHTTKIAKCGVDIASNKMRITALEQGSYNISQVYTAPVDVGDFHKHEVLVFNHVGPMDNTLPRVDDTLDSTGSVTAGRIATGHFVPVFNLSSDIVNFKTLGHRSKILDLRDMTIHNEFPMPTGAGSLITSQLPSGEFGYMYLPMAAPADPDPGLPPDIAALDGRVTILESFQAEAEEDLAVFPAVRTPNKYLIVNEDGTGYTMSTESVEDVRALATFAEGAANGNALLSVKSLGGDIGPVYTVTVTIEQFCQSNFISVSPVAGEIFYTYLGNIVPFDSTTIGADEVREGMLYYVANKGSGTTRLNAPAGHNIFTSTQSATSFDVKGETAVILMPSIYEKAGVTKKMWTTIGVFHTNVKASAGPVYDDDEVRELIATNVTNIAANTTDIETNATGITTIQAAITAMGNEWTTKFEEGEAATTAAQATADANTTGLATANTNITTNTTNIATNTNELVNVNAAIVTLTGRVDTAHENAGNAIGTANAVATRMTTAEGEIDTAQTDISNLQNSLTATGGDISGLRDRITPLETDMITVKGQVSGLDTRVEAIEALPEHPGLPPMEGNEGKYLCINDEGTAYAASTLTNTQALSLAAFGEGCQTGNSLVNLKCQGADTALTSAEITQTYFSTGNVVMGTPAGPASNVVVCNMGVIQPYTATTLAASNVREGCIITVANLGAGVMRLTPPSGCKIKSGTDDNWETYDLKPGRTVTLFPAIYDSRAKKYIVLSNVNNAWSE